MQLLRERNEARGAIHRRGARKTFFRAAMRNHQLASTVTPTTDTAIPGVGTVQILPGYAVVAIKNGFLNYYPIRGDKLIHKMADRAYRLTKVVRPRNAPSIGTQLAELILVLDLPSSAAILDTSRCIPSGRLTALDSHTTEKWDECSC